MKTRNQDDDRPGWGPGAGGNKASGRGRGKGRGRGGGTGSGPGGNCICTSCGFEIPHQQGKPCFEEKCPKCGMEMTRKN